MRAYECKHLREYIIRHAKEHSKRQALQEEYVQEAWLAISCAPGHYSVDALMTIAGKAIYSAYWKNYKETLLARCRS